MDKSYVVIVGNGSTSRANVEALIEDYFYAKGKDIYLALAFEKSPSQGQAFAAQYAKDRGKEVLVFCNQDANVQALPSASLSFSDKPVKDAIDLPDSTIMILWDSTDPLCQEASAYCEEQRRRSYNLCEGLALITRETAPSTKMVESVVTKPVITPTAYNIKKEVLETVISALQDALKKA